MRKPRPIHFALAVAAALVALAGTAFAAPTPVKRRATKLRLQRVDKEPKVAKRSLSATELKALKDAVKATPKDRGKRFGLVMALSRAGRHGDALVEAKAWRARDAYNLVVVRLIGDLHTELGQVAAARRAYSAVVELLPQDAGAQRALATVLKQSGQLEAAYQRLLAAARLRPEDTRIAFELADTAQRLGRSEEAVRRFAAIVSADKAPKKIVYPAKQRLGQLYAAARLAALKRGDKAQAGATAAKIAALEIKGGVVNDIKIYLTWDTNRTDVDLWVLNPAGETISYKKKRGRFGGALFDDVTDGYGPESFTAKKAKLGTYVVQVNYFGTSRRTFTEARGEVVVVLHEGTRREKRIVLPYRLFKKKQTVTVARIRVR